MASQLSESEIIELGKIFVSLDSNGDGTLTLDELAEGKYLSFEIAEYNFSFFQGLCKLPDFDQKEVQQMMSSMDTDKSGKVDYTGNGKR